MACVHFPCTSNLSINHNHFPKRTIYLKKEAEKFQTARIEVFFFPSTKFSDRRSRSGSSIERDSLSLSTQKPTYPFQLPPTITTTSALTITTTATPPSRATFDIAEVVRLIVVSCVYSPIRAGWTRFYRFKSGCALSLSLSLSLSRRGEFPLLLLLLLLLRRPSSSNRSLSNRSPISTVTRHRFNVR